MTTKITTPDEAMATVMTVKGCHITQLPFLGHLTDMIHYAAKAAEEKEAAGDHAGAQFHRGQYAAFSHIDTIREIEGFRYSKSFDD